MNNKTDVIKAALTVLCKCKGHPFNCYNHPNNCGCNEQLSVGKPKGGYCIKCNTVWVEPGVCNCNIVSYKNISVFEKEVWNAAIEAAANLMGIATTEYYKIRKLKKMSVEQLNLVNGPMSLTFTSSNDKVLLIISSYVTLGGMKLDRNEAHLLMLWLQEHLK